MKKLYVLPVQKNNPLINIYKDRIKNWDEDGNFMQTIEEDAQTPIYAIYFNDYFLAASHIKLNRETMVANIYTINGSNNHKKDVYDYMSTELPKIAENDLGATHYMFNHITMEEPRQYKKCI